jgi:methylated-DNA-[protein]-cysteine S-methyltransferase
LTPLPDHLLESFAAAAVRGGLADAVFCRLPSPIGDLIVVQGPDGIVHVGFHERRERALAAVAAALGPRVVASDRELAATREVLAAYLEGSEDALPGLPVDLRLVRGAFRRAALEALHGSVARGETVTYAELARRAGNPRAVRAAGSACATNPVPLVVPCHRVLPSSGRVGAYGLGGPTVKTHLLALEGALPAPPQPAPPTPRGSPPTG